MNGGKMITRKLKVSKKKLESTANKILKEGYTIKWSERKGNWVRGRNKQKFISERYWKGRK